MPQKIPLIFHQRQHSLNTYLQKEAILLGSVPLSTIFSKIQPYWRQLPSIHWRTSITYNPFMHEMIYIHPMCIMPSNFRTAVKWRNDRENATEKGSLPEFNGNYLSMFLLCTLTALKQKGQQIRPFSSRDSIFCNNANHVGTRTPHWRAAKTP